MNYDGWHWSQPITMPMQRIITVSTYTHQVHVALRKHESCLKIHLCRKAMGFYSLCAERLKNGPRALSMIIVDVVNL